MVWQQVYDPFNNPVLSTLMAAVPVVVMLASLAFFHVKAHLAALLALTSALLIAIFAFGMPANMAGSAALYGAANGLLPIGWIVLNIIFLHRLTTENGSFKVLQDSLARITDDRRLQLLLIAFCFGAFFEGAAGFGTPVAVTGAILIGLGFSPLAASGLALIANTAPVAFGALGIPIIVAGQVSGVDAFKIGAMAGRQLPILSVIVPFWLVAMMDGWRGVRETWPALLVAGGTFAISQFLTSNFIGPELPDITSALLSMVCLTLFLRVWQPVNLRETEFSSINADGTATLGNFGGGGPRQELQYSLGQIIKAWSPFLILTVLVTIWTMKPFKALFLPGGALESWVAVIAVPYLDQLVLKAAPIVANPTPMPAIYKFDLVSASGTAIFISALISMAILRIDFKSGAATFRDTLLELKWPVLTIGMVLAFAFVTNYSGMSTTLALVLAGTGAAFPFFSPFLGWLGVFLTGSDTSSNALFGSLQATTAHQIGVSDTLLVAANTTGGVTGKMISPQSIAVACAATGLVGKESDLFRFTLKHSLFFATIVGLITLVQAYWLTGMLVHH